MIDQTNLGKMKNNTTSSQVKVRKRNRVPISCTICRRRKVKCDKNKPTCNNCKKNGVPHLCFYLQPSWAKDLEEEELKFPLMSTNSQNKEKDRSDHSDTDSINREEEIVRLRQKIQELEKTIILQRQKLNAVPTISTNTPITASDTPVQACSVPASGPPLSASTQSNGRLTPIPNNIFSVGLDEIDLVQNFNLLYTSKRNTKTQFPIIYQISVMSWLFIIKNDTYLNELWVKIFNLRKYYEQLHTQTDSNDSTRKILELSKQANNFITNIKNSSSGNFVAKTEEEELDFTNFDFNTNTAKAVKPLLLPPQECPVTKQTGKCPVNHEYQSPVLIKRPFTTVEKAEQPPSVCPVTGSQGSCPVQHPEPEQKPKFMTFKKAPQLNGNLTSNLQCPMIRHNEGLKQLAFETKCPMLNSDLLKLAEDEDNEDSKVCPLMIGDARNLFREKLQNYSNMTQEAAFGASGCPVIGCDSNPAKRRKNNSKKVKQVLVLTDIKSMNFSNAREVIGMFERHLPTKKVAWLLINRFFDKLYIHLPIIDEYSFRERIAKIIGNKDSTTGQKIKLNELGSDYNEDFLNLCLAVIILRLSWLTLPSNLPKKFSQQGEHSQELTPDERVMIKPENMIPMVLVDLIKEIFTDIRVLSTPSVIILQVGMFLKYYNILAPEDGFELDDSYNGSSHSNGVSPDKEVLNLNSTVFLNSLISLAKTIGLNRDPLTFTNFQSSGKGESVDIHLLRRRHLWRKMWYSLININVLTNISLGDYSKHLNIEIDGNLNEQKHGDYNQYWDTKRPSELDVDSATFKKCFPDYNGKTDVNYERELHVIKLIDMEYKINVLLYKGMKALLNIKILPSKMQMDDILESLAFLVQDDTDDCGNVSELTCAALLTRFDKNKESELSASARIFKFKLFLVVKMLMFVLNYILFLNYELKFKQLLTENDLDIKRITEDSSYLLSLNPQLVEVIDQYKSIYSQYFERTLLLAIDNYNIFIQFFDNSNRFFPNLGGELVIYPFLMILNHRSEQFLMSLVLRLQQNDPIISQILVQNGINKDELLNKLFEYLKIFLSKLDKLTKHYYYAWRLRKLMKFFYNVLISSSKIFTASYTKMLAKNRNLLDQCPVLQDIKTSSVPVLPNQRRQAILKRDAERQSQIYVEKLENSQEMPSPVMSHERSEPLMNLDNMSSHNNNNDINSGEFNQAPSEFATQILNGISNDVDVNSGALGDNAQFELWDELMLDGFPVEDRVFNSTTPGIDFFNNGFNNDEEVKYGVNEIDFTNVDLSTLPGLNPVPVSNGEGSSVFKQESGWFQNY